MYEKLKKHIAIGKTLSQPNSELFRWKYPPPLYYSEGSPFFNDYYHELNPYFTFLCTEKKLFSYSDFFCVRDGLASFASFILNNHHIIPSFGTHFIIHPDLVKIIPVSLRPYFSTWKMHQHSGVKIQNAEKILLVGMFCEQYLKDSASLELKLSKLTTINPHAQIEVFLPIKRNPFESEWRESSCYFWGVSLIKDWAGKREIKFLSSNELARRSSFQSTYVVDLAPDHFVISDNSFHHKVIGLGGTVDHFISCKKTSDVIVEINLSISHSMGVYPLPAVDSIFNDLLVDQKRSDGQNPLFNELIHYKLRNL